MYQKCPTVFSVSFCSRHKCYISKWSVEQNLEGDRATFFIYCLALDYHFILSGKCGEKMSENDLLTNIGLQGLKWAIASNNSFTGHSTILRALFVKKNSYFGGHFEIQDGRRWSKFKFFVFFRLSFSILIWWYPGTKYA